MDAAGADGIAILDVDDPAGNARAEDFFHSAGHRRPSLPCPDDLDSIEIGDAVALLSGGERVTVKTQRTFDGSAWVGGAKGGAKDLERVFFHD